MSRRPKRSLGQNFLVDRGVARRIVEAVRVDRGCTVLEVGPGRGALTEGLVGRVEAVHGRLVLVELDDDLASDLAGRFRDDPHVEVVHESILDVRLGDIASPDTLSVVGNIPYNLTSPILFHLLSPPRPREIVVMVQREVADRIAASPGSRTYGALSVGVRTVASVEVVMGVPSGAFRPRPRVESVVLRIVPFRPAPLSSPEELRLRSLTRALFQWRRKQLGKTLRDHPDLTLSPRAVERALAAAGADRNDRPETVSPKGFVAMARSLLAD